MNAADAARGILLLDAVGCAAAAGAVGALPSVFAIVDPSLRSRFPVGVALTGTAVVCGLGARKAVPTRRALGAAACANAAWVAVGLAALPRQRTPLGRALVL